MIEPTLLLASAGKIGRFGSVFQDFGFEYAMRLRTIEVAPAGIGGEALFPGAWVLVTFNVPFSIRVTPWLDGIPQWAESVDLVISSAPADGHPQTHVWEIGWDLPHLRDDVEVGRTGMMGGWLQVEVSTPCPAGEAGILDIEIVEIEAEVVNEGGAPE